MGSFKPESFKGAKLRAIYRQSELVLINKRNYDRRDQTIR